MSDDVAHMALQRTRNATMQGRCVWHLPVIIVCMLRWVFTVRTEANKITISPLRGPRFYCTLQSILRYHCSCSNFTRLSGRSAIAAPTMHSFLPSHTRSSPHDSCTLPLHNLLLHAPIHIRQRSASRIGGVGDCCRGRPKVQLAVFQFPTRKCCDCSDAARRGANGDARQALTSLASTASACAQG